MYKQGCQFVSVWHLLFQGALILGPGYLQVQTSDHKVGWGCSVSPEKADSL